MKILVTGFGNVLRCDDGFGVEVLRILLAPQRKSDLLDGVRMREVGISGISLVQELMDKYDALIVVDATDRGGPPGTT